MTDPRYTGVRICQAISQPPQTQDRIRLLQEQSGSECHLVPPSSVTPNASCVYGVLTTLLQAIHSTRPTNEARASQIQIVTSGHFRES